MSVISAKDACQARLRNLSLRAGRPSTFLLVIRDWATWISVLLLLGLCGHLSAQTRTDWQQHDGLAVSADNPLGLVELDCVPGRRGDVCEYEVATIPTADARGWFDAPDPQIINFSIPSRVCSAPQRCGTFADFTYFQTLVDIPAAFSVNEFTISFSGMDDGSRVSICNSIYPECEVVPGSFVFLGGSGTADLAGLVAVGERNRVVVTQVDDCCSANNLRRAEVVLNGDVVEADGPVLGNCSHVNDFAEGSPVYLNERNMSVALGGLTDGNTNNTASLLNAIDAPGVDAVEVHNQQTHFWHTGEQLQLDFEFDQSQLVSNVHFWNYFSESYDVDSVDIVFSDTHGQQTGEVSFSPDLGANNAIVSQSFAVNPPVPAAFASAVLKGSNGQNDFQNIGFTSQGECQVVDDTTENCPVEVVFAVDTSSSMGDEISALCEKISAVESDLIQSGIDATTHLYSISGAGGRCLESSVVKELGASVPGNDGECGGSIGTGSSASESWGQATALLAAGFSWMPGATKVVVPISDEGPCNGGSPATAADEDALANAIQLAVNNNVIVSPIAGTGSSENLLLQTQQIAQATGGVSSLSVDPELDLGELVKNLIGQSCSINSESPRQCGGTQDSQRTYVSDPHDSRQWLGATVGTFAELIFGEDNVHNRQQIVDNDYLDTSFYPTGNGEIAKSFVCVDCGVVHEVLDKNGQGGLGYTLRPDISAAAAVEALDELSVPTGSTIGGAVWDLQSEFKNVAVFPTVDHEPVPQEALESTVYLSNTPNDKDSWVDASIKRIWLEGYKNDLNFDWDGFAYVVSAADGRAYRYVSIVQGGPGALLREGRRPTDNNEINAVMGVGDDLYPIVDCEDEETIYCSSANSDLDGDGWGWENNRSCKVEGIVPVIGACVDVDGDGYGWNGVATCDLHPTPDPESVCIDSDGDGWGWDGSMSCRVGPLVESECIDSDGDGWGWNGVGSCLIDAPEPVAGSISGTKYHDLNGNGIRDSIAYTDPNPNTLDLLALTVPFNNPIGIDYHEPSDSVVVSANYSSGTPHNFETLSESGSSTVFSSASGFSNEVKIASVRSGGIGGFTVGDLFTGNGIDGQIVRITDNGSTVVNPWVDLPGQGNGLIRGSLIIDNAGQFDGDLIVATTGGEIWRVSSDGAPSLLADVDQHLEGVAVVPDNLTRYGELAGKVVAGAERQRQLIAVSSDGEVTRYDVDVAIEDIEIVPGNANFFGVDFGAKKIVGARAEEFNAGDILFVQESGAGSKLFTAQIQGDQVLTTPLILSESSHQVAQWKHVTFAPTSLAEITELEPGLPGWTIFVDSNQNGVLDGEESSDISDENGLYHIGELEEGSFSVLEVMQSDWWQTQPAQTAIFNAVQQFSDVSNTESSTWSYRIGGSQDRNGSYSLLTQRLEHGRWIPSSNWWGTDDTFVGIGVNTVERSVEDNLQLSWPQNTILMHPVNGGLSVVSFLAPRSGLLDIEFSFEDVDSGGGNGIHWHVDLGGSDGELASGTIDNGGPASGLVGLTDIAITQGERINFVVIANGSYSFDSTALTASVRYQGSQYRIDIESGTSVTGLDFGNTEDVVTVENPPEIISQPVISANAGTEYRYPVVAEDPDPNESLVYSLSVAPPNMQIDESSGVINWLPNATQIGMFEVGVTVIDLIGLTDTQFFTVSVSEDQSPVTDLTAENVRTRDLDPPMFVGDSTDALNYDAQNLTVNGEILVDVRRTEGVGSPGFFQVFLFEDTDFDNAYSAGTDTLLGTELVSESIDINESVTVSAQVSGSVQFSGAPVKAFVDGENVIAEIDENNNVATGSCTASATIDEFDPVLEWSWESSDVEPGSLNVLSTPVVVDLNGDLVPDIVFGSTSSNTGSWNAGVGGILRAVDGSSGRELYSVTNPDLAIGTSAHIAAGDIDNDGSIDIIAHSADSLRLIAFEADGSLKWFSDGLQAKSAGAIAIADINGDGTTEIIIGRQVFNNNGALIWAGSGGTGGVLNFWSSVVADVDIDGKNELIAGNTLYDASGNVIWSVPYRDGYNGVGNFDTDELAEIVLVSNGAVRLFEHDGTIIWNTAIPGGGNGGSPTIADFDNDGEPEIGVAGATRYAVIETDGTVKWSTAIRDTSSNFTGSSVFDFEGDGSAEVIYSDELNLMVLDGKLGTVKWSTPISSCTAMEYPLVADVDADGNAEILAVGNTNCGFGPQQGLFVYGSASDSWVKTRSIWNQHSYHIDNINDDGSVPTVESPSWLSHNSYRLNQLTEGGEFGRFIAPDLTASYLRTETTGTDLQTTVRIGNGGSELTVPGVDVAFYSGDPTSGGTLLGLQQTTRTLQPGQFEDLVFSSPESASIWVVADDDGTGSGTVRECSEVNNTHSLSGLVVTQNAPIITSTPVLQASVGSNYSYQVMATDNDIGDTHTYSLVQAPQGMTIDVLTGQISWDPVVAGANDVRVQVSDLTGLTDTQEYQVEVSDRQITGIDFIASNTRTNSNDGTGIFGNSTSDLVYGSQNLQVTGEIFVDVVRSIGTEPSDPFQVYFFEDTDIDNVYTVGTDTLLGSGLVSDSIALGESVAVSAQVSGSVQFAGAPVKAFVDGENIIAEMDENNNVAAGVCTAASTIAEFDPVLEWNWTPETVPESANVVSVPLVGDLNNDGIAEIIFSSTSDTGGSRPNGILRAVDGRTGTEVFTVTESSMGVKAAMSMAFGDIDLDGEIEIVAVHESGTRLIAFEHDGTVKWQSDQIETATGGGVSIMNLDATGQPEILVGRQVLDSSGRLLWTGTGGNGGKFGNDSISIAADIDMDGIMEVLAGNTVYSSNGEIVWQSEEDGFNAIGNFDSDDNPEIVLVSAGEVRLFEHDGALIWSVNLSDGGTLGGAPTVGDFNNDGRLEIGVASSSTYALYSEDGQVLWEAPIQEVGLGATGASLFDFDGNGASEVVYSDTRNIYVLDGSSGTELWRDALSSCTWQEYPLVADVDTDGNAEILAIANNNCGHGTQRGLFVYGSASDSWVRTRGIWNQHSYHISNINDDGTIPIVESPSWLSHNSYRLNELTEGGEFGRFLAPDLTASYLRTQTSGSELQTTVRIGNGGSELTVPGVDVAFYSGDPAAGGSLLGLQQTTQTLQSGQFEDLLFSSPESTSIWVVADDDGTGSGTVRECSEVNNTHSLSGLAVTQNAPAITSTPVLQASVGSNYSYQVMATDSDIGDTLTYSLVQAPDGMTIDLETGIVAWVPAEPQVGSFSIVVSVADSTGLSDSQGYDISVAENENPLQAGCSATVSPDPLVGSASIDLGSWQSEFYPDNHHSDPQWILAEDRLSVTQIINSDSSVFYSAVPALNTIFEGSITALDNRDDDFIGFVVGFQPGDINNNSADYLLVDWKKGSHSFRSVLGKRGLAVSRVSGVPDEREFWSHLDLDDTAGTIEELMRANTLGDAGYVTGQKYNFRLEFGTCENSQQKLLVYVDNVLELEVEGVFPDGRFGFYNYSQENILYESFSISAPSENIAPQVLISEIDTGLVDIPLDIMATIDDDGLPSGGSLSANWTLLDGPGTVEFTDANAIATLATFSVPGTYMVQIVASDGELLGIDSAEIQIASVLANSPPIIKSNPPLTATVDQEYQYAVAATDADLGDTLAYTLVESPEGMLIDSFTGLLTWSAEASQAGNAVVDIQVSDSSGLIARQEFTIVVNDSVVNIVIPNLVGSTRVEAEAALNSAKLTTGLITAEISPGAVAGTVLAQSPEAGALSTEGSEVNLTIAVISESNLVECVITSPEPVTEITMPTPIVGNLLPASIGAEAGEPIQWEARLVRGDNFELRVIGSGTGPVVNSEFASIDPTLLRNDRYIVSISYTQGAIQGECVAEYIVTGNLKLGNFRLELTDLNFPVTGIPITVARVYDTLLANKQSDFGFGWQLKNQDPQILEIAAFGVGGAFTPGNDKFVRDKTRVYINTPDGRRVAFTYREEDGPASFFGQVNRPYFEPDPGVPEQLLIDETQVSVGGIGGSLGGGINADVYTLLNEDGVAWRYHQFDGLQSVTDVANNVISYSPDRITHSSGKTVVLIRDDQGRISELQDANGKQLYKYSYNAEGELESSEDATGVGNQYRYFSDPNKHFLSEIVESSGNTLLSLEFDDTGRMRAISDALANTASQSFDQQTGIATTLDAAGNQTSIHYDSRGNPRMIVDALGGQTNFAYEDADFPDNPTQITDTNGGVTTYAWDDKGAVSSIIDANGIERSYVYDEQYNLTRFVDGEGAATEISYLNGYIQAVSDEKGRVINFTWDSQGRLRTSENQDNEVTTYEYDGLCLCGRPTKVTTADGSSIEYEYNQFALVTLERRDNGAERRISYDNSGRIQSITDEAGSKTLYRYQNGRLSEIEDPDGNLRTFGYDPVGRLVSETNANGVQNAYGYDEVGNLTRIIDPLGNETVFRYDALGRMIERTDATGSSETFNLDSVGNVIEHINRNNMRRTFEYDSVNRRLAERWYDDVNQLIFTYRYDYDNEGRVTQLAGPVQQLVFQYDSTGNLIRRISNGAVELELQYMYGTDGLISSVTDSLGRSVSTMRDSNGFPISYSMNGNLPLAVDLQRTTRGDLEEVNRYNGSIGNGNIIGKSIYLTDSRLGLFTSVQHLDASLSAIPRQRHTRSFNSNGNIDTISIDSVESVVMRDTNHQIESSSSGESYLYDFAGNRTFGHLQGNHVTGSANRLESTDRFVYEYDNEGNMTLANDTTSGVATTFDWDHRNRLVSIARSDGVHVDYLYDALDQMVSRSQDGITRNTTYDRGNPWLDTDGMGGVTHKYFYGETLDENFAVVEGLQPLWYLKDLVGSVTGVVDSDGTIASSYRYDSFGILTSSDQLTQRFGFNSREYDQVTGHYYYRKRWYAPEQGRFISEDPLVFSAGDTNLYRYVLNQPLKLSDPTGTVALIGYVAPAVSNFYEFVGSIIGGIYGHYIPDLIFVGEILAQRGQIDFNAALKRTASRTDEIQCVLDLMSGGSAYLPHNTGDFVSGFSNGSNVGLSVNIGINIPIYSSLTNIYNQLECLSPDYGALPGFSTSENVVGMSIPGFKAGSETALLRLQQQFGSFTR